VAEYSRRLQQAVKSKLQAPGLPLSTPKNGGKWWDFLTKMLALSLVSWGNQQQFINFNRENGCIWA
jgi:hypothetical protein